MPSDRKRSAGVRKFLQVVIAVLMGLAHLCKAVLTFDYTDILLGLLYLIEALIRLLGGKPKDDPGPDWVRAEGAGQFSANPLHP